MAAASDRSAALAAEINSLLPWVIPDNDPTKAYVEWPPGSEAVQARVAELSAQRFSARPTDEEWAEIQQMYDELMHPSDDYYGILEEEIERRDEELMRSSDGEDDHPSAQEYRHPPHVEAAFAMREEMIRHLNLPGAPKSLHWGPGYVPNEWDTMNHAAAREASAQRALKAFFPDISHQSSATASSSSSAAQPQPETKAPSGVATVKPADDSKPSTSQS